MDNNKEKELAEIKRRLDYVITSDDMSDSEKVAILKNALEIIEKSKLKGEVE